MVPVDNGYHHLTALALLIYNFHQVQVFRGRFRENQTKFLHPFFKLFKCAIDDQFACGNYPYPVGNSFDVT